MKNSQVLVSRSSQKLLHLYFKCKSCREENKLSVVFACRRSDIFLKDGEFEYSSDKKLEYGAPDGFYCGFCCYPILNSDNTVLKEIKKLVVLLKK